MRRFSIQMNVTVDKQRLLTTLKTNKEIHIKKHAEAMSAWEREVNDILRSAYKKVEAKDFTSIRRRSDDVFSIPSAPKNMSDDYDQAISMLEWDKATEIELDTQKFQAFIHDEWEWKDNWTTSNAKYLGS